MQKSSKFYGKRFSILGDSISTFMDIIQMDIMCFMQGQTVKSPV